MGLIRLVAGTVLAALFFAGGGELHAQSAIHGQLGPEIQTLERRLTYTSISSAERYDALVRLARLRQLSGNIAAAAANWLEAAALNPGNDNALVAGAYCLVAIGEWESAALTIRPLLASGRRGTSVLQARYLDAVLRAWSSFDTSALVALTNDYEFYTLRPLIYYTLWQTAGRNPRQGAGSAEQWKSRLLAEFPKSPEARVVSSEKGGNSSSISAVQTPMWLLLPGMIADSAELPPPAQNTVPAQNTPAVSGSGTPAPGVVLQTGLFGKEANAIAQSDALRAAGFAAVVTRKIINGAERWVVTVPAGSDAQRTAQQLKNAGFDSFPMSS